MDAKRVKILKASYNEKWNLVFWDIVFMEDMRDTKLAWHAKDLSTALGIKDKNGEPAYIEPGLMKKFCSDIEGKEINLVIEKAVTFDKGHELSKGDMAKLAKGLDEMPMYETFMALQEEETAEK